MCEVVGAAYRFALVYATARLQRPETVAGTAEEALTRMAEEHDKILRENGFIK